MRGPASVLFAGRDGGSGASQLCGCGKLLAFAEFSCELHDHDDRKLMLCLRGPKLASEERRVLSCTRFDETPAGCFPAVPTRLLLIRSVRARSLLARQK